jgi:hypoxanthine-guanine phosphoribosyltransferase
MGIAEGGLPFTKLLSSFLEMPHEIAYLRRDASGSFNLPYGIPSNQIILADCIFDIGKTFTEASELLCSRGMLTQGVVLLRRQRELDLKLYYPQYTGLWVPGREFFVGFGLDDKEGKGRELPDIYSEGEIES